MNRTQLLTYLWHFLKARHYRGHGIHSPFLYSYIREVVIQKGDICYLTARKYSKMKVEITDNIAEALESDAYISIVVSPFRSRDEKEYWKIKRPPMDILTLHLPHHMVIFRDKRLHNQHFMVRR